MPSRNANTRPITWRIAHSPQVGRAITLGGYEAVWVFINIIASADNMGRVEGGRGQLMDWFFGCIDPHMTLDRVERCLEVLNEAGLIIRYNHRGQNLVQLPTVGRYSRPMGNMKPISDFPSPPKELVQEWEKKTGDKYTAFGRRSDNVRSEVEVEVEVEEEGSTICVVSAWSAVYPKPHKGCINGLSSKRSKKLKELWKSKHFRENYQEAIKKTKASSFMNGGGKEGWQVTFDWFIRDDENYLKVLEGKYDDKPEDPMDKYRRL